MDTYTYQLPQPSTSLTPAEHDARIVRCPAIVSCTVHCQVIMVVCTGGGVALQGTEVLIFARAFAVLVAIVLSLSHDSGRAAVSYGLGVATTPATCALDYEGHDAP